MAWDSSTDPAFQAQLDWMAAFVREEASDSAISEILTLAGTEDQKEQYLHPLLAGDLRSAFSMTEPHTAGADPTLLEPSAVLDGDEWVVTGRKCGVPTEHVPTRRAEARARFADLLERVTVDD